MSNLLAKITTGQALLIALGIIGCTTALAITGHIPGADALATYTLVAGGTLGVTGAHVGATAATNAATAQPTPAAVPPPAPSSSSAAPVSAPAVVSVPAQTTPAA